MARLQQASKLLRALGSSCTAQSLSGPSTSSQLAAAASTSQFTRGYAVEPVAPAATYTDIEDEFYLRQRSQITLGNRHPNPAVGAWISPSAVVVGDVDLFDRVSEGPMAARQALQPAVWCWGLLRVPLSMTALAMCVRAARTDHCRTHPPAADGARVAVNPCDVCSCCCASTRLCWGSTFEHALLHSNLRSRSPHTLPLRHALTPFRCACLFLRVPPNHNPTTKTGQRVEQCCAAGRHQQHPNHACQQCAGADSHPRSKVGLVVWCGVAVGCVRM